MKTRRAIAATAAAALLIGSGIAAIGTTSAHARHGVGVSHGAGPGSAITTDLVRDRWLESQVDRQTSAVTRQALREALAQARSTFRDAVAAAGTDAAVRETARLAYATAVGQAVSAFDMATLPADQVSVVTAYRTAITSATEDLRAAVQAARADLRASGDALNAALTTALGGALSAEERRAAFETHREGMTSVRGTYRDALRNASTQFAAAVEAARLDLMAALNPV